MKRGCNRVVKERMRPLLIGLMKRSAREIARRQVELQRSYIKAFYSLTGFVHRFGERKVKGGISAYTCRRSPWAWWRRTWRRGRGLPCPATDGIVRAWHWHMLYVQGDHTGFDTNCVRQEVEYSASHPWYGQLSGTFPTEAMNACNWGNIMCSFTLHLLTLIWFVPVCQILLGQVKVGKRWHGKHGQTGLTPNASMDVNEI